MNDRDYIRQRIRQAREELGLRQQDVAEAIGTSITQVSDVERGRFGVNADRLAYEDVQDMRLLSTEEEQT